MSNINSLDELSLVVQQMFEDVSLRCYELSLRRVLNENDLVVLGYGHFSTVIECPWNSSYVIKIGLGASHEGSPLNDAWLLWGAFCMDRVHENIPEVHSIRLYDKFYLAIVKKYTTYEEHTCTGENLGMSALRELECDVDSFVKGNRGYGPIRPTSPAEELGREVAGVLGYQDLDIHSENVMFDDTGTLIITDPFSFSNTNKEETINLLVDRGVECHTEQTTEKTTPQSNTQKMKPFPITMNTINRQILIQSASGTNKLPLTRSYSTKVIEPSPVSVKVGDKFKWCAGDGALWHMGKVYTVVSIISSRFVDITTELGDASVAVVGGGNWEKVDEVLVDGESQTTGMWSAEEDNMSMRQAHPSDIAQHERLQRILFPQSARSERVQGTRDTKPSRVTAAAARMAAFSGIDWYDYLAKGRPVSDSTARSMAKSIRDQQRCLEALRCALLSQLTENTSTRQRAKRDFFALEYGTALQVSCGPSDTPEPAAEVSKSRRSEPMVVGVVRGKASHAHPQPQNWPKSSRRPCGTS